MTFGPAIVAELLAIGAVAGFLAGLLGVGGGMMMVPFLTLIVSAQGVDGGHAVKIAIATSMASILFTSLASVRAHQSRGAVRWDLVRSLSPGLVLGGLVGGAGVFALLRGQALALGFAAFIGYTALQMLRGRPASAQRQLPRWPAQTAVGAGIGLASGLLGAGGAFLSVPFMTRCNVPVRHAVGTGAALGFPIALANTAGYVVGGWTLAPALPGVFGYLYLPAIALIAATSVVFAPLGARVAHRTDVRKLERLFALLLLALAATMLHRAWTG